MLQTGLAHFTEVTKYRKFRIKALLGTAANTEICHVSFVTWAMHAANIHSFCLSESHSQKIETFQLMIFNVTLPLKAVTNRPIWYSGGAVLLHSSVSINHRYGGNEKSLHLAMFSS